MRNLLKDLGALNVTAAQSVASGQTTTTDPAVYLNSNNCLKCGGSGLTHQPSGYGLSPAECFDDLVDCHSCDGTGYTGDALIELAIDLDFKPIVSPVSYQSLANFIMEKSK